ncbi:MAG: alkaline phosphatase family protein [Candidatus Eisenbacteria bacterium]|uniref:Alkaline phosphatase family protein n=1 Tax=Eiseniibacteriota bacterium TaxID=2212470 RepID=A0A948W4Y3_UNCEI|nr:alkaline phosphatase family protein [Candidatus Eisenbacteria bacterium]MBU1950599.1 alkaline phosphatase family protein [Candidatus Eisenbacteria bacterium]MBU2689455.1 alkaline phosphatase family protein [Candidatus Eisenbacteria bacterium]
MKRSGILTVLAALLLLGVLLPPIFVQLQGAGDSPPSKVVVLGFDGADARLVEQWMDEGLLPHLDRLRKEGSYSRLLPTNPPQTPVSWSTFATGLDPGRTTIFDFLKRDPRTYFPDFAMISLKEEPFLYGEKNPKILGLIAGGAVALVLFILGLIIIRRFLIVLPIALILGAAVYVFGSGFIAENIPVKKPLPVNNRQGIPFWDVAGQHQIKSTVIRVPASFPPGPYPNGRILSGLGVPDIRGTFGTYSYYTSEIFDFETNTEKGGKVIPLDVYPGVESVETFLYGPFNKLFPEPPEIDIPLSLSFDWDQKTTTIEVAGKSIQLQPGGWSDWVPLTFPINSLIKVRGISRFYLIGMEPDFKLYMSSVNFDPKDPVFDITYPSGFSKEIYDEIGYWKTLGWALDTWAMDEEVIDEDAFLHDTYDVTVAKFEEILHTFLETPDEQLYVQVFYFTDRVAHMFWRLMDTEHPAYNKELADKFGDAILVAYQKMDDIVGWTMDRLPEDGAILICSDHGFSTWKWSFNINTWLRQNGFLALKNDTDSDLKNLDDLFVSGTFWENVDWDRTRAYALGLGCIYINLLGREANGIVTPGAEYEELCAEITAKLEAFVDPETGICPVHKVFNRKDIYSDFDANLIPDLRAGNNLGYRVSWQTSLGGVPKDLFEIHTDKWSGDHCSLSPELVKGIFFSNWKFQEEREPQIGDLCPTVLNLLSVPVPDRLDSQAILLAPATP